MQVPLEQHTPSVPRSPPQVVNPKADADFRRAGTLLGFNPDDQFCGRYAEYEWNHLRHVIDLYVGDIAGKTVLEIGCHVGASMVVLATLGAKVTGIEINEGYGRLTEFNLRRYGLEEPKVIVLPSAPPLPFSDSSFDLVCCNSVLEYVSPSDLCFMMKEIGRVVRPGGIVLILGTSNRLWPCEGHSHRWFVNYVPRSLDRFLGHSWARGVFPWQLSGPLADLEAIDQSGRLYGELHRRFGAKHSRKAVFVTAMSLFARCIGISPGRLGPSILAVLRRRVPR